MYPFAGQMKYLHFFVILRPRVLIGPAADLNPRPPALQSCALPTKLILPQLKEKHLPGLVACFWLKAGMLVTKFLNFKFLKGSRIGSKKREFRKIEYSKNRDSTVRLKISSLALSPKFITAFLVFM